MMCIYVVALGEISGQLQSMIDSAVDGSSRITIDSTLNIPDLTNKKILFAAELNAAGFNLGLLEILSKLYDRGSNSLSGSTAALLVHSTSQLYTKNASQSIIFLTNQLGCSFPGHPIVEATENLENLMTWQKQMDMPLNDICLDLCAKLGKRLIDENPCVIHKPNIVALHSSYRKTSNTLGLWHMVSSHLSECTINELHVENGDVLDCKGCSFKTCIHYSMQNSCFYGGVMVNDILPAIEKADAVVWICPNYNDAVSANLTAVINRITALYRKMSFYNKSFFSVIVSGNSGSDSVARQLIGALNINKGFRLPPYFTITAVANDTGAIYEVPGIEEAARRFAYNMLDGIRA